jgi:hypothetical protein
MQALSSLKNQKGGILMVDHQMKVCANCGSVWKIESYSDNSWIDAELATCPLCCKKEQST